MSNIDITNVTLRKLDSRKFQELKKKLEEEVFGIKLKNTQMVMYLIDKLEKELDKVGRTETEVYREPGTG